MKKLIAAVAVAALTIGSMSAADARIGGSGFSRGSTSSVSASRATTSSAGTRIGGGGNVGVSRPTAMAAAVSQSQATRSYGNVNANSTTARTVTTTQTTRTTGYDSRPGYYGRSPGYGQGYAPGYAPAGGGYTGGHLAAAAVAGAVGGAVLDHALSNRNNGTTILNNGAAGVPAYSNGGAPVYGNGGGVVYDNAPAQVVAAPGAPAAMYIEPHHSGIGTFFAWIFGFIGVVFVIWLLARLFSRESTPAIYDEPTDYRTTTTRTTTRTTVDADAERVLNKAKQLLANGPQIFRNLQDANNRGDKAALQALVAPSLFPTFAADIDQRDGASKTVVKSIRVVGDNVLDVRTEGDVVKGSLHFKGVVNEGGAADDDVSEIWHFATEGLNGPWKLEGIEQFPQ